MKRFSLTVFLLVIACSDESKVKDAALEAAQARFETEIRGVADEKIQGRDDIKRIYVRTIVGKTEFDVEDVAVISDNATATLRLKTVPGPARNALLEIIARHDRAKDHVFNVPNALKLVYENLGLESDASSEIVYKLNLRKSGDWRVEAAP